MFRRLSECLVASFLWLPLGVSAGVISELSDLIEQGKSKQAYQLSLEHITEFEGDPAFDLQYGTAAIDSGQVSEGVFALERVHFLEPQNYLASLELARGYFLLKQYTKAAVLFNQVIATSPPNNVQVRIRRYLDLIDNKTKIPPTKFNSFVELWAGHDSNINSGPSGQTDVVILSDNALGRSDPYFNLRAGASINHAYSPENSLLFDASIDSRIYDTEHEQDFGTLNLSAGHLWKVDGAQYQLKFNLQKYELDNHNYRDLLGASGVWTKQLSRTSIVKVFGGVNSLAYDGQTWRDSTQVNLGANYLLAGAGGWKPLYFMGAFVGDEDPEVSGIISDSQVDRLFYGGNIGVQLSPIKDINVTPVLTYQVSKYKAEDWIYNIKRKDRFAMFNINMEWIIDPNWTLLANYSYTDVGSNIELYRYDRQQTMLGIRYNFL
jgi:tetratricopeptide (TPR) repeat protein